MLLFKMKKLFYNKNLLFTSYHQNVLIYYWFRKNKNYYKLYQLPRLYKIRNRINFSVAEESRISAYNYLNYIWLFFWNIFSKKGYLSKLNYEHNFIGNTKRSQTYNFFLEFSYKNYYINNYFSNLIFLKLEKLINDCYFLTDNYYSISKKYICWKVSTNTDLIKNYFIINNMINVDFNFTYDNHIYLYIYRTKAFDKLNTLYYISFLKNFL
jgi:hypothetical protein